MKTKNDPRHQHRIQIVKDLFAQSFQPQATQNSDTTKIVGKLPQIDEHIAKAAPAWPLPKVAKLDLSILRLAVYELLFDPQTPSKVIVDEAVELAKEFGSEQSAPFINGVLGTIISTIQDKKNVA